METMRRHLQMMTRYHRTMQAACVDSARSLVGRQGVLDRDSGLPMGSIRGTFNHMLVAENIWYCRMHGLEAPPAEAAPPSAAKGDGAAMSLAEMYAIYGLSSSDAARVWRECVPDAGLNDIGARLKAMADLWVGVVDGSSEEGMNAAFEYKDTKGTPYTQRVGTVVAHMVNHGTHHRGQISGAVCAATGGAGAGGLYHVSDVPAFLGSPEWEQDARSLPA